MAANNYEKSLYPEEDDLQAFINRRNQRGLIWQMTFLVALMLAILALVTLIYNIVNSAFGLVAIEDEVPPASLVADLKTELMLRKPNTINSEEDLELVAGVEEFETSIGFFGYAFYQNSADQLKLVSVDGVMPSAETALDGSYPLSRPLYIYTSPEVIEANPAVGAFVDYYLNNVNSIIEEVGYFPISAGLIAEDREIIANAGITLDSSAQGAVEIAGSSTVFPVTQRLATDFGGDIRVESVGSSAGIRAFCVDGTTDIANASRAMTPIEVETCRANGREPIGIQIGTDAIAVVVNPNNAFVNNLTSEELGLALTE
ncbi:MAG: substrate-binding domain-containing protein, partial [Chloroflexota bacterium]